MSAHNSSAQTRALCSKVPMANSTSRQAHVTYKSDRVEPIIPKAATVEATGPMVKSSTSVRALFINALHNIIIFILMQHDAFQGVKGERVQPVRPKQNIMDEPSLFVLELSYSKVFIS